MEKKGNNKEQSSGNSQNNIQTANIVTKLSWFHAQLSMEAKHLAFF